MNALAITHPKVAISPVGIEFTGELDFDEWESLGKQLVPVANSIRFIVGDWINYGAKRYGGKYEEALKRTGLTYSTLSEYAYVARKIQFCARAQNVDYAQHRIVAKIKDPEEQKKWLQLAAEHDLSERRLRKSINFGRLATPDEVQGDPADRGYVTYLALLNRLRRWWKRETGKAPVEEWDEERREVLKRDFKVLLEIYESL